MMLSLPTSQTLSRLFLVALLAQAGLSPQLAHATEKKPTTMAPVEMQAAPVRQVDLAIPIRVPGTVESVEQSTLAAKIQANVAEIMVKLGTKAQKGELLARLQAHELEARVVQAKAQLSQVQRSLALQERLLAQQAATQESVRSLRDSERIALATLREAEVMLSYTEIRAPYAGVISQKMVDAGDLTTPGMPLFQLEGTAGLQVKAQVPGEIVEGLSLGQSLPIAVPSIQASYVGKLVEIAPASNPSSRTSTIVMALNPDNNLRSGQYVLVLLPGKQAKALVIPPAAVSHWGQMERVFVLKDGRAQLRLVRTGAIVDGGIEITTGLDMGEIVLLGGSALLSQDQPVRVRP